MSNRRKVKFSSLDTPQGRKFDIGWLHLPLSHACHLDMETRPSMSPRNVNNGRLQKKLQGLLAQELKICAQN